MAPTCYAKRQQTGAADALGNMPVTQANLSPVLMHRKQQAPPVPARGGAPDAVMLSRPTLRSQLQMRSNVVGTCIMLRG